MSILAEVMQALRFTEEQNRLILENKTSNDRLAEMFRRPKRQIQRQRALLRKLEESR